MEQSNQGTHGNPDSVPVFQNSLGTRSEDSSTSERSWSMGWLQLAKVIKVHHKRNTVDVEFVHSNNRIKSDAEVEGRHACQILVPLAGVDTEWEKPYGDIIPLEKGMYVVVAFMRNQRQKPLIIGTIHEISEKEGEPNYENILPVDYPIEDPQEEYRTTHINRTQDCFTEDGLGYIEWSRHSKMFFYAGDGYIDEEEFDYEDLHTKEKEEDPETGEKKTIHINEKNSQPMKFLTVFRDKYKDEETNWFRVMVDAKELTSKVLRQQQLDNKLTSIDIDNEGTIRVRRQQDAMKLGEGSDYTDTQLKEDGELYFKRDPGNGDKFETHIKKECDFTLEQLRGGKKTTVDMNDSEVKVYSDNPIYVESKEKIELKVQDALIQETPDHILLTIGGALIKETPDQILLTIGGATIKMTSSNIKINAPTVNIN